MTPEELRRARERLGLTKIEASLLLETDCTTIEKMERPAGLPSHRPAPARVAVLYQAFISGFRPPNWPERLRAVDELV